MLQARDLAAAQPAMALAFKPGRSLLAVTARGIERREPKQPSRWRAARMHARLSTRADEPFSVAPADDAAPGVRVRLAGAAPSAAEVTDGVAVYPDVHPATDALVLAEAGQLEVFYLLRDPTAPTTWRWQLELPPHLSPRQEDDAVVLADETGRGRLFVHAREGAVDAAGTRHPVTIKLDGNDVEFALAPAEDVAVKYPVLVDPAWVIMTSNVTTTLRSVWGTSPSALHAVGMNSNKAVRWDGSTWFTETLPNTVNAYGVWGDGSGADTNVFSIAHAGGDYVYKKESSGWAFFQAPHVNILYGIWGPPNFYHFYLVGQGGLTFSVNPSTGKFALMTQTVTTNDLYAVTGVANEPNVPTMVVAVGASGTVIRHNGTSWVNWTMGGTTSNNLNGVIIFPGAGAAACAVVVGDGGTILFNRWAYDPGWFGWSSGTTEDLHGVWGTDASNIYAVGDAGTILHYNGTSWSKQAVGLTTSALYGVFGTDRDNVFAVGANGTILRLKCAADADCPSGQYCTSSTGGDCLTPQGNGTSCAGDTVDVTGGHSCTSGRCVDGYCCGGTCTTACYACNVAGSEGSCSPTSIGSHKNGCGSDAGEACDLACDGAGQCGYPGPTQTCGSQTQTCSNGTVAKPQHCNAAGVCVTDAVSCGGYQCDAVGYDCLTSCADNNDCLANYNCQGGVCLGDKALGAACVLGSECASGSCADRVCCDTECQGSCQYCKYAGKVGTCTAVPVGDDPRLACQASSGGHPDCAGACAASGQCAYPDLGTPCGLCAACDGIGRCTETPLDGDACGTIECSGLDTACRVYQDLTTNRCASLGTCKTANDPATCTQWSNVPCADGGVPTDDGGLPGGDGGLAATDGGTGGGGGGGCGCATARQPGGVVALLVLLLGVMVRRRGRRRPSGALPGADPAVDP